MYTLNSKLELSKPPFYRRQNITSKIMVLVSLRFDKLTKTALPSVLVVSKLQLNTCGPKNSQRKGFALL